MPFLRKYNTAITATTGESVKIPLIKRGVVDFALSADWTPAAGDVKVSKDGGAAANIATLPSAVAMGNTAYWEFVFSGAELSCKTLVVTIADSATKAVEDQEFIIETFGNASALYPYDLTDGVRLGLTALPGNAFGDPNSVANHTDIQTLLTRLGTPSNFGGGASVAANLSDLENLVDGVETDTAAIIAAIAALNDLSAAEVNAEADTALSDYGALKPTTAGRTLDVSATGEAGIDWANIGSPTTSVNLSGTTVGTATALGNNAITNNAIATDTGLKAVSAASGTLTAGSTTTATLPVVASAVNDFYKGLSLVVFSGAGAGQSAVITGYVGATRVATLDRTLGTALDNTSGVRVMPYPALFADPAGVTTLISTIGAAGAGLTEAGGTGDHLTAIPWNASWDAEVQSEVADALTAYGVSTQSSVDAIDADVQTLLANLAVVDGNVDDIETIVTTTGVPLTSAAIDAIWDDPMSEPAGRPAWASMTARKIQQTLGVLMLNEINSDSDSVNVRNDADSADLWAYPSSDDGTTFTSGEAV